MSIEAHDAREGYCRTLGHTVAFAYCREMNRGKPCRLVADCWHEQFDAAGWLSANYTAEQVAQIVSPPPAKMTTLLELIERARRSQGESTEST